MPTGDLVVNPTVKRFLSWNRISDNLIDYLRELIEDGLSRIFPSSGLFTYPPVILFPGANVFTITPDPLVGIDNAGRVLHLEDDAVTKMTVDYEDDGASLYWVAMKYCQVPEGIIVNPRTGFPEYDLLRDEIGETANPDSVTDLLPGLRLEVPAAIYPYPGRECRVWLVDPESTDASIAIQILPIQFGGGIHYVDVPDYMGQTNPSLTVTDYMIQLVGVSVAKDVAYPFTDDYVAIGCIDTVPAPNGWSYADALDLSGGGGHTLQHAYDGLSGSGSGRQINVDDQAVELRQCAVAHREDDIANASLRIVKDITTDPYGVGFESEGAIDVRSRMGSHANVLIRSALSDLSGNDYLRIEEAASIAAPGNTVTFGRVGVDLLFALATYQAIAVRVDMIEISGSLLGNDGLYYIWTTPAGGTTCTVRELDRTTAPALVAEAGLTVRLYRPFVVEGLSPGAGISITTLNDFYREANAGVDIAEPAISVTAHSNATDSYKTIGCVRNGSGEEFSVSANGDVDTDGHLHTGTEIVAATGDISASTGDVKAVLGDISSLAGDVNAHVNISATTGDITATAGDIVATAGDIVANAGNVVASLGSVEATVGDVTAGNDLIFGTQIECSTVPSFHVDVPIHHFVQNVDVQEQWKYAITSSYIHASGAGAICDIPIHVHHGNTISTVTIVTKPGSVAAVDYYFVVVTHDYTAPVAVPVEVVSASATSDGTTNLQRVTLNPVAPPTVSSDKTYLVRIESKAADDRVYTINIDVDLETVYPF